MFQLYFNIFLSKYSKSFDKLLTINSQAALQWIQRITN